MKKILYALFILMALMPIVSAGATVSAASDTNDKLFSFCQTNPDSEVCKERAAQNKTPSSNPVNHIIRVAGGIITLLAGAAAVILVIASGIGMITSAGNPEGVANARKRLTSALIGLVIIALAWTLIAFVTNKIIL